MFECCDGQLGHSEFCGPNNRQRAYRAFDLKAKELGYWQVQTYYPSGNPADTFLVATEAAVGSLVRGLTTPSENWTVRVQAPDEWEARG